MGWFSFSSLFARKTANRRRTDDREYTSGGVEKDHALPCVIVFNLFGVKGA